MAPKRKIVPAEPSVADIHHDSDQRVAIPTAEMEPLLPQAQRAAPPLRYRRDADLDPQLVWKGKDAEDDKPLVVDCGPIYVQEKVSPLRLIQDQIARSRGKSLELSLFESDFNGAAESAKLEFYSHSGHWTNRLILGNSLEVMTSLAERESLRGEVQTIYFDPPYGIDFGSNWQVSTRNRNVRDSNDENVSTQPEQIKAYRDTWRLGVHSYLSYVRDRLIVSRDLLAINGSFFFQISDANLHLVRSLLDEVFGHDNFIAIIPFRKKTMPLGASFLEQMDDFILWYAKDRKAAGAKFRRLFKKQSVEGDWHYKYAILPGGSEIELTREQTKNHALVDKGARLYMLKSLEPSGPMESGKYSYTFRGKSYPHPKNGYCCPADGLHRLELAGRIAVDGNRLAYKLFADDFAITPLTAPWQDTIGPRDKRYVVQTSDEVVERCIMMTTDPGDLVLDPSCGSGTTAFVSEKFGRRWITIDTSRVALMIARQRIMTAAYKYYLLADSKKGRELTGDWSDTVAVAPVEATGGDLRLGFVYRKATHITLNSIANNDNIKDGMTPREVEHAIEKSVAFETLYNDPVEVANIVRLSGPFTVESLSPYSASSQGGSNEETPEGRAKFGDQILDALRKAGVGDGLGNRLIGFNSLDPWPGSFIHALGRDASGARVAVSIGPRDGTVGMEYLRAASREAVNGALAESLIVCAFAFDSSANAASITAISVQKVRMNVDLQIGENLKVGRTSQLFALYGEPDVKVERIDGGVVVELLGMDVFDPATREFRASGLSDIAAWFIDTDYDSESFFVRQAYFLGDANAYDNVTRALNASIDLEQWSKMYSSRSLRFDAPPTGKIAVKVITQSGDEALKVIDLSG